MSAFKFECPNCGQHFQGDETYIGRQINCPSCQRAMTVPNPAAAAPVMPPPPPVQVAAPAPIRVAAAVPPPSIRVNMPAPVTTASAAPTPPAPPAPPTPPSPAQPAMRIAAHAASSAKPAAPPPAAPKHIPTPMPIPKFDGDDEAPSRKKKFASIAVMVVVALLAGFVLIPLALKWQKSFNEKQAKDEDPGLIGGQVGHALELNNVLDATDPDKMGLDADRGPAAAMAGRARKARAMSVESAGGGAAMDDDEAMQSLPVVPATWTLDAAAAQIPNGRVAGTVAGASFAADHVLLLTGGATPVLAFRQGSFQNPDRELILFPKLKPGQSLENQSWTITADQTAEVPQVAKRWKAAPNTAPQMKSFNSGYVLKLEFGKMTPAGLPGKIYLALPDTEHSVAGGMFVAGIRVAGTNARSPGNTGGQSPMMSDE